MNRMKFSQPISSQPMSPLQESSQDAPSQSMLQLRYASIQDLPVIVEIYNSTITSRNITADIEPITVESRHAWFEAHSPETYPIWVAEREGQVLGWLSFQPFYGRPAYRSTAEFSIYVSPFCRRQGIGQKLLQEAIARCPDLNFTTLLGFVFAQNQPSLELLKRFGFQEWGFLPSVAKFDVGSCDLVILGRKI
ncbi:MAG: GNAT family N-acetyltransferase [Leptolyngbyaceae bacterium]|nr:GNAT family N-acetyltransferase [Leptolyngbyaceae bacterium]